MFLRFLVFHHLFLSKGGKGCITYYSLSCTTCPSQTDFFTHNSPSSISVPFPHDLKYYSYSLLTLLLRIPTFNFKVQGKCHLLYCLLLAANPDASCPSPSFFQLKLLCIYLHVISSRICIPRMVTGI